MVTRFIWQWRLARAAQACLRIWERDRPDLLREVAAAAEEEARALGMDSIEALDTARRRGQEQLALAVAGNALIARDWSRIQGLVKVVDHELMSEALQSPHVIAAALFGAPPALAPLYLWLECPEGITALFAESTRVAVEDVCSQLPEEKREGMRMLWAPDRRILIKARDALASGQSLFLYVDNDEGSTRQSAAIKAFGRERRWGHGAGSLHLLLKVPIMACAVIYRGSLPFILHFQRLPEETVSRAEEITSSLARTFERIESAYGVGWGLRGAVLRKTQLAR